MKLVLSPEWVAVETEEVTEKETEAGILLHKETVEQDESLRVGKLVELGLDAKQLGYTEDEEVLFSKYAATQFDKDGYKVDLVATRDLIAKIKYADNK
jgi:co-chaperonin GroES (HSP10)